MCRRGHGNGDIDRRDRCGDEEWSSHDSFRLDYRGLLGSQGSAHCLIFVAKANWQTLRPTPGFCGLCPRILACDGSALHACLRPMMQLINDERGARTNILHPSPVGNSAEQACAGIRLVHAAKCARFVIDHCFCGA